MKKLSKVLALGATCLVSLTACDIDGKKAIQNIERIMLQKAKSDECFGDIKDDLNLSFTAYKVDKNNEATKNVVLYSKINGKVGYSSFFNMYYSNVPNSYFDLVTASSSEIAKLYKVFENIVSSDLRYTFSNYQVKSFDSIEKTIQKFVPSENSQSHKFDHLSIATLSNLNYDNVKMCASFDVDLTATYEYTYTYLMYIATGGYIPITQTAYDEEKQSYTVSYYIDAEEYETNKNDSQLLIGKFQQYVAENQTDKYIVTSLKNNNIMAKNSKVEEELV